jgi:endonuclease YncB( thermonuclease family)
MTSPSWKPGDLVNGHRLSGDGTRWEPVPPLQAARARPWHRRPLGITGIAIGSVFVLSMGAVIAGGGDAGNDTDHSGKPAAASTPDPTASPDTEAASQEKPAPTPAPKPKPASKPKSKPKPQFVVTRVVDGDTIGLSNGAQVRLVGIDTAERGQCGYTEASDNMARLVLGRKVTLAVSDEDTDRYGRLLRYLNVGTLDAGLRQIKQGYAIARYNSRDGYGFHPREPVYSKADEASKPFTCAATNPQPERTQRAGGGNCMSGYAPCLPVVADLDCGDIGGPVRVTGSDPYRLDADGDGIGCDS